MNDKTKADPDDKPEDADGRESEDAGFDDALDDSELVAEPPATGHRLLWAVAGIALALGAAGLAAGVYVGWLQPDAPDLPDIAPLAADIDGQGERLDGLEDTVAGVENELAGLRDRIARLANDGGPTREDLSAAEQRLDNDIAALERQLERSLDNRLGRLENLQSRVDALEASLSALQGISTGVRDTWHLAEAEYYLQLANAQLSLAANPELARMALRLADEKLRRVSEPGLTDVRRAVSAELQALESVETPDVEGAALTLANLAGVVASLPLDEEVPGGGDAGTSEDGEADSGVDRALRSLKDALSDVVTVRRTDEPVEPLMAPEAAYFLRQNLALQLQAARLALLRGDQALFQQSLDDAASWLRRYYDTGSAPVKSALLTLTELRNNSFVTSLPDISASLDLLRQYMELRSATRPTEAGRGDEPPQ